MVSGKSAPSSSKFRVNLWSIQDAQFHRTGSSGRYWKLCVQSLKIVWLVKNLISKTNKQIVCVVSHGRSENYETTRWTDFKTLTHFYSRNLLERSFAIALFRSALFSLTCLFCISLIGSPCIEEFSCWDSVHFFLRYFFTHALVNSLFIFNVSVWFFHLSSLAEDN